LRFVNPANGASVFPTLAYAATDAAAGEETRGKRETASTMYTVIEGSGATEIAASASSGRRTTSSWCRTTVATPTSTPARATRCSISVSDAPLMEKIGQYRAQGRLADGTVEIWCVGKWRSRRR